MRRVVIFGRHDLLQDAPISRVDLLLCRNTLMYFNAEAQARILSRFFFSLNPGGHLLLGRAEMLFRHAEMFEPVDLKRRLFAVVGKGSHRDRLTLLAQAARDEMSGPAPATVRLREAAFDASSGPQLVVDFSGRLVGANAPARSRFGLTAQSIGQPLQDLELSYRPAELRGAIARAMDLRIDVAIRDVPWNLGQESRQFDVTVGPLLDDDDSVIGSRIVYRGRDRAQIACRRSSSTRSRSWKPRTKSCSPPTRSSKPPTRSCSRRSRSSRPRTRSCNRPTKSSRR